MLEDTYYPLSENIHIYIMLSLSPNTFQEMEIPSDLLACVDGVDESTLLERSASVLSACTQFLDNFIIFGMML